MLNPEDLPPSLEIIGIGTDLCDFTRIEKTYRRFEEKFLNKFYTKKELDIFYSLPQIKQISFLTKRFCAKEACVKAIGTGFTSHALWKDIHILNTPKTRKPFIDITGITRETCLEKSHNSPFKFHLSMSDEKNMALAFCVFARKSKNTLD